MTNQQLKMLDKLIQSDELINEEEKLLYKLSMLHRELYSFESQSLLALYDKYFGYGRE